MLEVGSAQLVFSLGSKRRVIPVSVTKKTPPEKKTLGQMSLKSIKSGAGEEFLRLKGVFFHRHR